MCATAPVSANLPTTRPSLPLIFSLVGLATLQIDELISGELRIERGHPDPENAEDAGWPCCLALWLI